MRAKVSAVEVGPSSALDLHCVGVEGAVIDQLQRDRERTDTDRLTVRQVLGRGGYRGSRAKEASFKIRSAALADQHRHTRILSRGGQLRM